MDLRSIHCLRFLRDAFRGRKECIAGFQDALKAYIEGQLTKESNLVSAKLATEAIGLMDKEGMEELLVKSLELSNTWIGEYAVKSCWHIDNIDLCTKKALYDYFEFIPISRIIYNFYNYQFFLNLSSSFIVFYRFYQIRIIRLMLILILSFVSLFTSPILVFVMLPLLVLILLSDVLETLFQTKKKLNEYKKKSLSRKKFFFNAYYKWIALVENRIKVIAESTTLMQNKGVDYLINTYLSVLLMSVALSIAITYMLAPDFKQLPQESTLNYFLILISLTRYHSWFIFFKLNLINRFNISFRVIVGALALIAVRFVFLFIGVVLFIVLVFVLEKKIESYFLIPIVLMFIALNAMSNSFDGIWAIMKNTQKYKRSKRNIHDSMSRVAIQNTVVGLPEIYQIWYIKEIESHVKTVTGEWPDPLFLSDKNSEVITRLAKLEEKWLGLDR